MLKFSLNKRWGWKQDRGNGLMDIWAAWYMEKMGELWMFDYFFLPFFFFLKIFTFWPFHFPLFCFSFPTECTLKWTLDVWPLWLTLISYYLWFDLSWLGLSALIWMEMEFWRGMNCNFFMRSNCIEWSAWPKNLCYLRIYCARLLTWLDLRFVFQSFVNWFFIMFLGSHFRWNMIC